MNDFRNFIKLCTRMSSIKKRKMMPVLMLTSEEIKNFTASKLPCLHAIIRGVIQIYNEY